MVQFSFKKECPTVGGFVKIIDNIVKDNKAFDCVSLEILVKKLQHYGLRSS